MVATARADPIFAFHHVNAFDESDHLVIDMIAYDDATIIDALYLARLRAARRSTRQACSPGFACLSCAMLRWHAALSRDVPLELPRINYETHAGKPYRHVWGTSIQVEGDFLDSIVKIDVETGKIARWYDAGLYPGEPVFVPSPHAQAETRRAPLRRARYRQG